MKFLSLLCLLLFTACTARKGYTPDNLIKNQNLRFPVLTQKELDVSKATSVIDSMWFFYRGGSDSLEKTVKKQVDGGDSSLEIRQYSYRHDTTAISYLTISLKKSDDTIGHGKQVITSEGLTEECREGRSNCISSRAVDKMGLLTRVSYSCPDEKVYREKEFIMRFNGDHYDMTKKVNGTIDSSFLQQVYCTPFDGPLAIFIYWGKTMTSEELYFYRKDNKLEVKYNVNTDGIRYIVAGMEYHSYNAQGRLERVYYIDFKDDLKGTRTYTPAIYIEYFYDSLGRKMLSVTRQAPDKE
jgi:hypothetical protein